MLDTSGMHSGGPDNYLYLQDVGFDYFNELYGITDFDTFMEFYNAAEGSIRDAQFFGAFLCQHVIEVDETNPTNQSGWTMRYTRIKFKPKVENGHLIGLFWDAEDVGSGPVDGDYIMVGSQQYYECILAITNEFSFKFGQLSGQGDVIFKPSFIEGLDNGS